VRLFIPATDGPAASLTDAISETVTATPDTVAAVTEEVVKPIIATTTTKPNPMPGMKTMIKSTEDFFAFGQANVEAFVKSGQIWADGTDKAIRHHGESLFRRVGCYLEGDQLSEVAHGSARSAEHVRHERRPADADLTRASFYWISVPHC
jgi:hypothetical protein